MFGFDSEEWGSFLFRSGWVRGVGIYYVEGNFYVIKGMNIYGILIWFWFFIFLLVSR